jgi:hypothetical protein
MSSTTVEVVFEGAAVKTGVIDARLLAESLSGYSEVFTRANAILNGDASEAAVLVHSDFKAGSFIAGLEFVQSITEQGQHLITAHNFLDAASLAAVIGFILKNKEIAKDSLIDLYKWLKGKKPDKAVQIGNAVEITVGQDKKTVNNITYNLYGDRAIKAGLERLTNPLRQAAIERIAVKQDGKEQTAIEKSEASSFETGPFELQAAEEPLEGQRDAVLVVSKLAFTEKSTWTFLERGATVVAKIEDKEFWENVHHHKVTFGEGDRLRVRLFWTTVRKRHVLAAKNTIIRVYEVIVGHKQLRLGGETNE